MIGLWKAISDYPFDRRGIGPLVLISFMRDGGRTTRMAYAAQTADGGINWHCSDPLPSHARPDLWLDIALLSGGSRPDYASAVTRKIEELTASWPSHDADRYRAKSSGFAAE